MNNINFNIDNWTALSPGLITPADWLEWSKNNGKWPAVLSDAPVNLIKPMMRRRMSNLSKLALQAALQITSERPLDYIIFSSRHGELSRTVQLLEDVVNGEDASPMAFSQSVHNTAAGLFTISAKRPTPVSSIAATENSLHHALIEAAIYLQENTGHQVLVVDFDEPLPEQYKKYSLSNDIQGYAFAALLSAGDDFKISWSKNKGTVISNKPQSLSIIDLLIQGRKSCIINDSRLLWSWERK